MNEKQEAYPVRLNEAEDCVDTLLASINQARMSSGISAISRSELLSDVRLTLAEIQSAAKAQADARHEHARAWLWERVGAEDAISVFAAVEGRLAAIENTPGFSEGFGTHNECQVAKGEPQLSPQEYTEFLREIFGCLEILSRLDCGVAQ